MEIVNMNTEIAAKLFCKEFITAHFISSAGVQLSFLHRGRAD
jgi:hypothetical protein